MKNSNIRRPFVRSRGKGSAEGSILDRNRSTPVFQSLEPRKLLTTLVSYPNSPLFGDPVGETSVFTGFIAMPKFITPDTTLDAGDVESRSVRVRISISGGDLDPNDPTTRSTVTILDLNGNPLFPWLGQPDGNGGFDTEVEYATYTGDPDDPDKDDGFWGTGDDITESGFGLDVGYIPGFHYWADDADYTNDYTHLILPNSQFYLVGVYERTEDDSDPPVEIWDEASIPTEGTLLIPETGYWYQSPITGGLYRSPFDIPDLGVIATDDRLYGTADDPVIVEDWYNPDIDRLEMNNNWPNFMTRSVDPELYQPASNNLALQKSLRQRYTPGTANDGIADFNNGIGRIIVSNATATTRITISVIDEQGLVVDPFQLPEESDIGIDFDRNILGSPVPYDFTVLQAPGMGQVIVGNNTNADWTVLDVADILPEGLSGPPWQNFKHEYNSDYPERLPEGIWFANATVTVGTADMDRFNRVDYIEASDFVQDNNNETIGRVVIDGALFGTSRFPGAIEHLHVGYLGGSVIVEGEISDLVVAGDAGYVDYTEYVNDTNNFVQVGRNLGSFIAGNRISTEIFVEGDLNSVVDKPFYRQDSVILELESLYETADQQAYNNAFASGSVGFTVDNEEGLNVLRNDTFGQAQYLGRVTSYIEVYGDMRVQDSISPEDTVDIYAVAVDGLHEVRISLLRDDLNIDYTATLTIQDEKGRILASRQGAGTTGDVVFTPDSAGLIYIVLEDGPTKPPPGYRLIVRGLAPTTLGEVRSLGMLQYAADKLGAITTEVGSIGDVRVGQDREEAEFAFMGGVVIDAAENLWNLTAGHSIGGWDDGATYTSNPVIISAGQNIGSVIVGVGTANVGGGEYLGGSIFGSIFDAGGSIGKIWATGAGNLWGDIGGISRDGGADLLASATVISAGGSIGVIHADNRIMGANELDPAGLIVNIGANGVIDLFEAGALISNVDGVPNRDLTLTAGDYGIIAEELEINTGVGGNVRFLRAPHVYSQGFEGADIVYTPQDILDGKIFHGVDDSGADYTIELTPGNASGGFTNSSMRIVTQPIANSQGVALTRLVVNMQPGADLTIRCDSGTLEIGDLIVMGSPGDTGQEIHLVGNGQIDVYYMRAVGDFKLIENTTNGDMVAMDVGAAGQIRVNGNLGRTTTIPIGPDVLGPELGSARTTPPAGMGDLENLETRLALIDGTGTAVDWTIGQNLHIDPGALSGSDTMPISPFLNGLTIRDTNYLTTPKEILVEGTLGDLIIQNNLKKLIVNSDKYTPFGDFNGIEGHVYAYGNIEYIQLGDGLVEALPGPTPDGVISALGSIERVDIYGEGHDIKGVIVAAGVQTYSIVVQNVDYGIDRIQTSKGSNIFGAYISGGNINDFWDGSGAPPTVAINRIQITDGNLIDTYIEGLTLERIDIRNGYWDDNILVTVNDINQIIADSFKNTAGTGYIGNVIRASGDIKLVEARGGNGDIEDLGIDIQGNLKKLKAFNIAGSRFEVDETIAQVDAKGSITRSEFSTGSITKFIAANDIARVTIDTSGAIKSFQSKKGSITRLDMTVNGPDGSLDNMSALNDISGNIVVAGSIKNIITKSGDINASIITTGDNGDVSKISAARDMLATLDISGDVKLMQAKRNIGNGGRITVQGDLNKLDASKGTIDAQIFVEGDLTSSFRALTFAPGTMLSVLGRINQVNISSDVEGTIVSHSNGISRVDIQGDLKSGSSIASYDGGIKTLTVTGDVVGSIYSDEDITSAMIKTDRDSTGGNLTGRVESQTVIKKLTVYNDANGATVQAGNTLDNLEIKGNATNSVFGAGTLINKVNIRGDAAQMKFVAGLYSFGDDGVIGGVGLNADTYQEGSIARIDISGSITDSVFVAGVTPAAGDIAVFEADIEAPTAGLSIIDRVTVRGAASGTNLFLSDTGYGQINIDGTTRNVGLSDGVNMQLVNYTDPDVEEFDSFANKDTKTFTETDGDVVELSLSGDGTGWYQVTGGQLTDLILEGTSTKTRVEIKVISGSGDGLVQLNNVAIATFDDASLSSFILDGKLDGSDSINIDGDVNDRLSFDSINTSGTITVGGDTGRITANSVAAGIFNLNTISTFETTNGGFTGTLTSRGLGTFSIKGNVLDGIIYGRDYINTVNITGMFGNDPVNEDIYIAYISTTGDLGSLTAASTDAAIISAGDTLGNISINGNVRNTDFLAGFSLGSDANYGGVGTAGDNLTDGVVQSISVKGSFSKSSVAAGVDRGLDGFYGNRDDLGALGISEIKNVNIKGRAEGSNFGTESYAFTSNGIVGSIRDSSGEFTAYRNLKVASVAVSPEPVRINLAEQRLDVSTYFIDIYFSEDLDTSSIIDDPYDPHGSAITLLDVDGNTVSDLEYEITYDKSLYKATIKFDIGFTRDNPGIYTLVVESSSLRSVAGQNLDANGDGVAGDDYKANFLLGDAGDRVIADPVTWDPDGNPDTDNDVIFEGAVDFDLLLDDPSDDTLIPRRNYQTKIVDRIGNHPDHEPLYFPDRMDIDVYKISLNAGDIIVAGLTQNLPGSEFIGILSLVVDVMGVLVPVAVDASLAAGYIVQSDGTYWLEVSGATLQSGKINTPPFIDVDLYNADGVQTLGGPVNPDDVANDIGRYELNVQVFDDHNTGFDRGENADLVTGQTSTFARDIGTPNTVGNPTTVLLDADVFDISEIRSDAGADGIWRTDDDTIITEIPEGSTITIVVDVESTGSDLGDAAEVGLFKLTDSGLSGGLLVSAPGFDDGTIVKKTYKNETITLEIPETGRYAVMVQGSLESNYDLLITVDLSTAGNHKVRDHQNVLLELNGSYTDWLGRFGTEIDDFDLTDLGFQEWKTEILSVVKQEMEDGFNQLYQETVNGPWMGVDLRVSFNSADFGNEEFTTVFIANNNGEEAGYGGLLSVSEPVDTLNQDQAGEIVIFLNSFSGYYAPGQWNDLGLNLAQVINYELGHSIGLRNALTGTDGIMGWGGTRFTRTDNPLGDNWFLGQQDEVQLLEWVFDLKEFAA